MRTLTRLLVPIGVALTALTTTATPAGARGGGGRGERARPPRRHDDRHAGGRLRRADRRERLDPARAHHHARRLARRHRALRDVVLVLGHWRGSGFDHPAAGGADEGRSRWSVDLAAPRARGV